MPQSDGLDALAVGFRLSGFAGVAGIVGFCRLVGRYRCCWGLTRLLRYRRHKAAKDRTMTNASNRAVSFFILVSS